MSDGWKAVVVAEAVEFISTLPARERRRVLDLVRQLTEHPTLQGDHVERDEVGRPVQIKRFGPWAISFWPDHGAQWVCVVRIERLLR